MSRLVEVAVGPMRRRAGRALPAGRWVLGACAGFLGLIVVMAVLAPVIAPHDPNAAELQAAYSGPSAAHLLGTDDSGRDLLSRLIYGARLSLLGPSIVVLVSGLIGTLLGTIAAWCGGKVDAILSRGFDIVFAFPGLLFAITAVALFGTGFAAPVVALSVAYTPSLARVIRSAVARERRLPYVQAALVQGFSPQRICARNILPNVRGLILVQSALAFGYAMVDLAAVSFLGLGVQPPTAEWGLMVADGQPSILQGQPAESLYAGVLIVLVVLSVNLLGERLSSRSEVVR